jgi:hypothetical protein
MLPLFACSGCTKLLVKIMGLKKPKPTTDQQAIQYVKDHRLDYDYLLRPKTNAEIASINRFMKIGANSIVLYDSAGNEIANTSDSNCHMNLRSQITWLLEHGGYTPSFLSKNAREIINDSTICLNCNNGQAFFEQQLKPYILLFSLAKFIPLKQPFSDIDYVQELKQKGLRNKITIVLLEEDLHPEK